MSGGLQGDFDRQVENLCAKGYPTLAGMTNDEFMAHVEPLAQRLPELRSNGAEANVPFVIVIRSDVVPTESAMPLVELDGRRGVVRMDPTGPQEFSPIEGVELPHGIAYLVADVDPGAALLNVTPDAAVETIVRENRSPLTIDEGVALLTHYPEILVTGNCFSILGSRRGDRRVPALWISAGSPRLGWCWAGNPHTWLGSASCGSRVGA